MEVNHYGDTIIGAVAVEDLPEGRMVLMTSHSYNVDFGSQVDLPGAELADDATEAARSRYVVAFAEDNRSLPIYQPTPSMTYALRGGWDQPSNVPFAVDNVYLTHPNNLLGQIIPSGNLIKLYGEGIYTVPSGAYMYNVLMETPGCQLSVASTAVDGADNAGKLKYLDGVTGIVAEVYQLDTVTGNLTFKILH